jgi:hypothetical protein
MVRWAVINVSVSLFLEWARVLSSDRDKMTFKLPDEPDFDY